jgi:SAM-dependent methyltransferase
MKPFIGRCSIRGVDTDHWTPNAICPRCHSFIRQRFIVQYLQTKTDLLAKRQRVLHFAPEVCIYKMLQKVGADYVAVDIDPSRFIGAVFGDILSIPFQDNDFDALICIHVLEHIEDDRKAIGEIYRVLKAGGQAIIAVPTYGDVTYEVKSLDYAGRAVQYGTGDHVRMNGLDFAEKLHAAGFEVKIVSVEEVEGNFIDHSVQTSHTESDRYLFHCTKYPLPSQQQHGA